MTRRKIPKAKADTKSGFANRATKTSTGGIQMVVQGMLPAIKTPCAECPLRRDSAPGYLGGYTPEMYIDVMRGPASLACHSSKGFGTPRLEQQRHCTGVAAFRANVGIVAGFEHQVHGFVPTKAHDSTLRIGEDKELYFGSEAEFYEHHKKGQTDD